MSTRVLTPRECAQQAIAKLILDFRLWMQAETKLLSRWKSQRFAYAVAEGRLVNDFNAMVDSYRKKENDVPMLLIAVQQVAAPPDLSQVIGIPFELKFTIPTDPLKRKVHLRTEPRSYHVQFVFLANDPDSANAFTSQFCSYVRLMEKRRIMANYFLSPDVRQEYHLTIFDNSLYPDKADLDESNLVAGLVEFDLAGLVPRVVAGLPPLYGDEFSDVDDPNGPGNGSDKTPEAWNVVVEADMNKDEPGPEFTRLKADPITGERTEEQVQK
jgi:hypothetical protein